MPSEAIEALLRAADAIVKSNRAWGTPRKGCQCSACELEAAATAVRAELAREPTYDDALAALLSKVPPLSDDALLSIFDEDVKSPSASLLSGLRAVARAARGGK